MLDKTHPIKADSGSICSKQNRSNTNVPGNQFVAP